MNLLSGGVKFLCSPLIDAYNWSSAKPKVENENKLMRENEETMRKHFSNVLPLAVDKKIRTFIEKELGIDSSKVHLCIDDSRTDLASHSGSIKDWGYCILCFSSDFVKKMETTFSEKEQFYIVHEMAHDSIEDADYQVNKIKSSSKFKLVTYAVSTVAINYFFPGLGYLASHVVGVVASKLGGGVAELRHSREHEKACDLKAVKGKPKLAKGGIEAFKDVRSLRLALKAANPGKFPEIDDQGENIYDRKHYPGAVRIKYLSEAAKS